MTPDDVPPATLAELIELGPPEPRRVWRPQELGSVWRAQLSTPLRLELCNIGAAAAEGLQYDGDAGGEPPRLTTFGDLLHGPRPSPEVLRIVKDFAKSHRHDPQSHLPVEVATALYCLSIVAALVRRGCRLTSMDDGALRHNVEWALAQPWLDDKSQGLLQEAGRHLAGGPAGPPVAS